MTSPLSASANATFDSSGNAQVQMGPGKPYLTWRVTRYVTFSPVVGCSLILYKNFIQPIWVIDATENATNDTGGIQVDLSPMETLIFVWRDGVAGQIANAILEGIQISARGRNR